MGSNLRLSELDLWRGLFRFWVPSSFPLSHCPQCPGFPCWPSVFDHATEKTLGHVPEMHRREGKRHGQPRFRRQFSANASVKLAMYRNSQWLMVSSKRIPNGWLLWYQRFTSLPHWIELWMSLWGARTSRNWCWAGCGCAPASLDESDFLRAYLEQVLGSMDVLEDSST